MTSQLSMTNQKDVSIFPVFLIALNAMIFFFFFKSLSGHRMNLYSIINSFETPLLLMY